MAAAAETPGAAKINWKEIRKTTFCLRRGFTQSVASFSANMYLELARETTHENSQFREIDKVELTIFSYGPT